MPDNSSCYCEVRKIDPVCSTLTALTPYNAARLSMELKKYTRLQDGEAFYAYNSEDLVSDVWRTNLQDNTHTVLSGGVVSSGGSAVACLTERGVESTYTAVDLYSIAASAAGARCWLAPMPNINGALVNSGTSCVSGYTPLVNCTVLQRWQESTPGPVTISPWGVAAAILTPAAGQAAMSPGGGSKAPDPPEPPESSGTSSGGSSGYDPGICTEGKLHTLTNIIVSGASACRMSTIELNDFDTSKISSYDVDSIYGTARINIDYRVKRVEGSTDAVTVCVASTSIVNGDITVGPDPLYACGFTASCPTPETMAIVTGGLCTDIAATPEYRNGGWFIKVYGYLCVNSYSRFIGDASDPHGVVKLINAPLQLVINDEWILLSGHDLDTE